MLTKNLLVYILFIINFLKTLKGMIWNKKIAYPYRDFSYSSENQKKYLKYLIQDLRNI